jgi:CheY-like chemotaxis protein
MAMKKRIFWFEDNVDALEDYCLEFKKKYDIIMDASEREVFKERPDFFDLVLLDLMIHTDSVYPRSVKKEPNVSYNGVHWMRTGVEFLLWVRNGEYEPYGFKKDVPVIVVTAVVNYPVNEMKNMGVTSFLEKPVTLQELEEAIEKIFNSSLHQGEKGNDQ